MNPVIRGGFPFTQERQQSAFVRAERMNVYDQNGKRYVDLCSGLWNMPLGYSNALIKDRITEQIEQLPFSNMLSGFSSVQEQYAKRLVDVMGDFACVLYTCSGSESVEAAIKTCRKYQRLRNQSGRKKIGAFSLSYHGTSYGAMSVSGIDQPLTDDYAPLLPEICWCPVPSNYKNEQEWAESIDVFFVRYGEELAGFIVEPVFASGGVVPVPAAVLRYLQKRCRQYDALFVIDEVATGFGRTGTMFAYEQPGLSPDLVCLSKAINNGYLPLGALVYGWECARVFLEKQEGIEHFSTQGGNTAAVSAAIGMLECMRDYASFKVAEKGNYFLNLLKEGVGARTEVRGAGLMIGVDFPERFNGLDVLRAVELFRKRGFIVYMYNNEPYNRGISFFPSFLITEEEIEAYSRQIVSLLQRIL